MSIRQTSDNLALLYQGMLTAIVRIQSGKQTIGDPHSFQRRMEELLTEIEREAIKIGYRHPEIDSAHYAVIAFLDESVLSSSDPGRMAWNSLAARIYHQTIAGAAIFERLKQLLAQPDSPVLADVLEVYFLCFTLGYEGRYAVTGRTELNALMNDLTDRIERIRGRDEVLSPQGALPPDDSPARRTDRWIKPLTIAAASGAAFLCFEWIVQKVLLNSWAAALSAR